MSASTKEQVVIKDACILFDLIDLGLLSQFYRLQIVVITTPQVLDEITDEDQIAEVNRYVETGQLQLDQFGQFEAMISITDANPGLSFTDASVLEAAIRRNAVVLSSDKSLRNESLRRGIPVKGLLWILEELYLQTVIERTVLLEKLKAYPEVNRRAPVNEVNNLIKKYKL